MIRSRFQEDRRSLFPGRSTPSAAISGNSGSFPERGGKNLVKPGMLRRRERPAGERAFYSIFFPMLLGTGCCVKMGLFQQTPAFVCGMFILLSGSYDSETPKSFQPDSYKLSSEIFAIVQPDSGISGFPARNGCPLFPDGGRFSPDAGSICTCIPQDAAFQPPHLSGG